jgi:hypothetical protein
VTHATTNLCSYIRQVAHDIQLHVTLRIKHVYTVLIYMFIHIYKSKCSCTLCVATPLWVKCEDETHTPESENLESLGKPKNSELDCRGQNTLHWGVFYIIEKILKCRCPKWPRMSHLDMYSPSYGQKKGLESNWQFDSRPLKVRN